jgi:hypothetical protein
LGQTDLELLLGAWQLRAFGEHKRGDQVVLSYQYRKQKIRQPA